MSGKRQATTNLNSENWDQEDPADHEEMGMFTVAPKDVLEKRVIRTAKRRAPSQGSGDEVKKSVFSGFGGFDKPPPSSFDFLANLTNGSKPNTNGTDGSKSDTTAPSGLFSSKPSGTITSSSSPFSIPVTSSPATKTVFGISTSQSSLFGGTSNNTVTQSPFAAASNPQPATDSPFKMPTSTPSGTSTETFKSPFKSPFASTNSSPFKTSTIPASSQSIPEKKAEVKDDKKLQYYAKLKALNESVSDWIKKHVEETPLCILSPIFKDYENHLKEIQDEYESGKEISKKSSENIVPEQKPNTMINKTSSTVSPNTGSSPFSISNSKPSVFGGQSNNTNVTGENSKGFAFGINTSTTNTSTTMTSGGFSFGNNTMTSTNATTNPSPFSVNSNTASTGSNGGAPFSFGIGKPFSFSANVQKAPESNETTNNEDEDEPPKVEFTPIVEENSVFDKRCKIFVKKDGNFVDKGVGTLYIKKVEETGKHQLLVRANTNLGNILLNLILSSGLPIQRLGKNNVMMVCIPTPDAKSPPTSVLIRVKTSEEADELLETLNKFKA